MDSRFSLYTTSIILEKVKLLSKKSSITNNDFVNNAIKFYINHLETRFLSEFMYYVGFPTAIFIGFVGITLLFPTLFFYILTSITGIYLIILFYLFYNKYRKVKNGNNSK